MAVGLLSLVVALWLVGHVGVLTDKLAELATRAAAGDAS